MNSPFFNYKRSVGPSDDTRRAKNIEAKLKLTFIANKSTKGRKIGNINAFSTSKIVFSVTTNRI